MQKGVYIKTYGCQMNVYDSAQMEALLKPHGFNLVNSIESADIAILNTCHIREKAAEKVYSELGRIAKIKIQKKKNNGNLIIVVAGCVAQAEGEEVLKRAPFVDIVVGPQSYHNLPVLIEETKRKQKWEIKLDFSAESKFDSIQNISREVKSCTAFLSIQEGCDKFCHFCVVPYTRGAEYSRKIEQIYREAIMLVSQGVKEITLLGQNVNAYHGTGIDGKEWRLGRLIKEIAKIDGLERIRYTTSHPIDMNEELLFEVHGTEKKLMPFVHLPVQSGSDKILKAMNRKHTTEYYLEIISKFKKARNDIVFSSDFIVGYPGETEKDFEETIALIKEVKYAQAYSFKYSPRAGTPASIKLQIDDEVKSLRLQKLQSILLDQQLVFNQEMINKTLPVLVDKKAKFSNQMTGKSPYMQSVIIENETDNILGKILNIKISAAMQNCLIS